MAISKIEGPRPCKQAEVSEMIALVDSVFKRKETDQSMLTDYPLVYQSKNLENVFILKVDNQIVSVVPFIPQQVKIYGCEFSIGIISPTATSPDHSKKGYALECLKSCIEKMEKDRINLSILWTLVPTFLFYEHGFYQGVQPQSWSFACLKNEAHRFRDNGETVVKFTDMYISELKKMHETEMYSILRTTAKYKYLFNLPKMETLVALQNDIPVAYIIVSKAVNKPGMIEGGGDPKALETIIHRVIKNMEIPSIEGYSYLTHSVLSNLLEQKLPVETRKNPAQNMMVRINNISGFIGKISKWLEEKNNGIEKNFSIYVTDTGETISFRFSKNALILGNKKVLPQFEFTRRELTSVIFGQHPDRPVAIPDILLDLFPFYFPVWILDRS
jgi:hypothetical protein